MRTVNPSSLNRWAASWARRTMGQVVSTRWRPRRRISSYTPGPAPWAVTATAPSWTSARSSTTRAPFRESSSTTWALWTMAPRVERGPLSRRCASTMATARRTPGQNPYTAASSTLIAPPGPSGSGPGP